MLRVAGFANFFARFSGISLKTSYFFRVLEVIRSKWLTEIVKPSSECLNDAKRVSGQENVGNNRRLLTKIETFLKMCSFGFWFSYFRLFGCLQILVRVCRFWYSQSPLPFNGSKLYRTMYASSWHSDV